MVSDCIQDSGFPEGWTIQRVGDFSAVKGGKRLPAGTALTRSRTDHPYLRIVDFRDGKIDKSNLMFVPNDVFPRISRYTISAKDIWISIVGTVGLVGLVDDVLDGANLTENAAKICNIAPHVDKIFLSFFLRSPVGREQIRAQTVGSTQPKLALFRIEDIQVPLPPIAEQHAIAHILGSLDEKIELNRMQNETFGAMAHALFTAWFVDFEPVRAKMEGRWQRDQSFIGLPAYLYDLFPDRFVESELGEIPEGWERIPFGSLLESTIGGDWGKEIPEDDHNQAVSIIRGTDFPDVSSGGIGKVPTRYTTAKKLASRQLQAGDIVLEISGGSPTQPTGRSVFISESTLDRFGNAVVCASFCRRFQPKNRELSALAFMHLQNLYSSGGTWEYQNQSTGIANFQTTRFLESEMVVMPTASLLAVFATQTLSLLEKMSSNESLALVKLRDTLLPKLVSGEVRVPDVEKIVGAMA